MRAGWLSCVTVPCETVWKVRALLCTSVEFRKTLTEKSAVWVKVNCPCAVKSHSGWSGKALSSTLWESLGKGRKQGALPLPLGPMRSPWDPALTTAEQDYHPVRRRPCCLSENTESYIKAQLPEREVQLCRKCKYLWGYRSTCPSVSFILVTEKTF